MKAWSVIGLLFTAAILATIPISPQVTPRGVELSVDQAQASLTGATAELPDVLTAAATTVLPAITTAATASTTAAGQPIGGGGGQWYPW